MKMWKLKEEVSPVDYIPLNRRIEWIARSIMTEKGGYATTDDILSAIYTLVQNDPMTPEEKEIIDVLNEIAVPHKKNGSWIWELRKTREATLDEFSKERLDGLAMRINTEAGLDHSRIIRAIAVLGLKYLGFNVWIGRPERGKAKDLNEVCNIRQLGTPVTQRTLERMEMVDVIWMRNGSVPISMFEAEGGDARRALVRMGDILREVPSTKAILVLADDNIAQMDRIAREPTMEDVVSGYDIYFTTYTTVATLLGRCERGRSVNFPDVLHVCKRMPSDVA